MPYLKPGVYWKTIDMSSMVPVPKLEGMLCVRESDGGLWDVKVTGVVLPQVNVEAFELGSDEFGGKQFIQTKPQYTELCATLLMTPEITHKFQQWYTSVYGEGLLTGSDEVTHPNNYKRHLTLVEEMRFKFKGMWITSLEVDFDPVGNQEAMVSLAFDTLNIMDKNAPEQKKPKKVKKSVPIDVNGITSTGLRTLAKYGMALNYGS